MQSTLKSPDERCEVVVFIIHLNQNGGAEALAVIPASAQPFPPGAFSLLKSNSKEGIRGRTRSGSCAFGGALCHTVVTEQGSLNPGRNGAGARQDSSVSLCLFLHKTVACRGRHSRAPAEARRLVQSSRAPPCSVLAGLDWS